MEIEVRQNKMIEIIAAGHVALARRAEGERDFAIGRRINLLGIERL